ncbi:MAG: COX15/CtaA family protein [Steroidobacteraceae bacterium]|nr:COX15/CtaA family protein [Steroidobacteraceae bacterium]MDW8259964.1 COX15/CtaA family protein [Gammaproteobacteria bacterium]
MTAIGTYLRWLTAAGIVLCLTVVVMGAWVRLTDAGLGCPDWPTCYGHVTPAGALANREIAEARFPGWRIDSGKAWREMIHRYAAATLGIVIVLIAAIAIVYRREHWVSVPYALLLLLTVVLQGLLGAFTVWWLVKPLVVVLHLLGGLATLGLLFWLWLELRRRAALEPRPRLAAPTAARASARHAAVIATLVVTVQIALGGWTSSNYAAVSCPDLPRCQGAWWPAGMDFANAFVLWRGLDINYTGGVLEHPARVAIHFTHRLGAIVATLAVLWAAWLALRHAPSTAVRNAGLLAVGAVALQVLIGILMVLQAFPLELATAHNAGAALLLLAMLTLNRRLREA